MLGAEVDRLKMAPLTPVPHMQPAAVLARDQALEAEPVFEHVGRAPFAADRNVVADVPPEVVGEVLRSAVDLPLSEDVETLVVEQEDAARSAAAARAHGGCVNGVGPTMKTGGAAGGGGAGQLPGFDHFDDLGRTRLGLGVENVDARGAQTGHQQVAALNVWMRRVGT